jgi:nucleotide-binding universal stress UspA family protein
MSNAPDRVVIVGALDRTTASESVVHTASRLAFTLGHSELHVLHVVEPPAVVETAGAKAERLRDARGFIDSVAAQVSQRLRGKVSGHVAFGRAREQILQLASDLEADLVVVGSHRKSAAGRWLLGSVSQAIVADAPCAVLVARPKIPTAAPEILPPCHECLEVQRSSHGDRLWCTQHATRHVHGRLHHIPEVESTGGSSVFIRT